MFIQVCERHATSEIIIGKSREGFEATTAESEKPNENSSKVLFILHTLVDWPFRGDQMSRSNQHCPEVSHFSLTRHEVTPGTTTITRGHLVSRYPCTTARGGNPFGAFPYGDYVASKVSL